MIAVLSRIRTFVGSLTGRMTIILTIGMTAASILSLYVAERARRHDFERIRINHVVDSAVDLAARFDRDPAQIEEFLATDRVLGAKVAQADWNVTVPDARLTASLRERMGPRAHALAMPMSRDQCFPHFNFAIRVAGMQEVPLPDCWLIRFKDTAGADRRLAIYGMPFRIPPSSTLDPRYLSLILLASAILSFLVARAVTTPLRRLTQSARAFSVTVDPDPIPEAGPPEVRAALATFNLMQHRVREGFRERTQILASVTHDLQTPLTRLRLRLEQVADETLRERLISDLAVTQQLVREDRRHVLHAEGYRRAAGARRFRHRLFVARLSEDRAVRQDQDRPVRPDPQPARQPRAGLDLQQGGEPRRDRRPAGSRRLVDRAVRPGPAAQRAAVAVPQGGRHHRQFPPRRDDPQPVRDGRADRRAGGAGAGHADDPRFRRRAAGRRDRAPRHEASGRRRVRAGAGQRRQWRPVHPAEGGILSAGRRRNHGGERRRGDREW